MPRMGTISIPAAPVAVTALPLAVGVESLAAGVESLLPVVARAPSQCLWTIISSGYWN